MGLFEQARDAEQRGNHGGRDRWERFAPHRARLTEVALQLAPPSHRGRICLLGAGNGNDVDLDQLTARFAEVHLVDIDAAAVAYAVARQSAAVQTQLVVHAPVDLSGLYHQLDQPAGRRAPADVLINEGQAHVRAQLPGDFDVVVSCCLLSQMSWALGRLVGKLDAAASGEKRALWEQALVAIHLRAMLGLCGAAGVAVLVTDMISSEAYPLDELDANTDLSALVDELAQAHRTYAVSNPTLIRQLIRRDPVLRAAVAGTNRGQPWLWNGAGDRIYLVYPLIIRPAAVASAPQP